MISKCFAALAICALLSMSLSAHHATAAAYDTTKTITFKGVISKLEWTNPHVHVQVEVKGEGDITEVWDVEFSSPGGVIVAGLSKDMLKSGTIVTIKGYPGKIASPKGPSTDS